MAVLIKICLCFVLGCFAEDAMPKISRGLPNGRQSSSVRTRE